MNGGALGPLYIGAVRGALTEICAGQRIDHLIPPGHTEHAHRSCSCQQCRTYYEARSAA